ncbi:Ascorbate peroxidase, partial [Parasponia andersonii]
MHCPLRIRRHHHLYIPRHQPPTSGHVNVEDSDALSCFQGLRSNTSSSFLLLLHLLYFNAIHLIFLKPSPKLVVYSCQSFGIRIVFMGKHYPAVTKEYKKVVDKAKKKLRGLIIEKNYAPLIIRLAYIFCVR